MVEHPTIRTLEKYGEIPFQHDEEATYVQCSVCGCEIWSDREEMWIESPIGALCEDCVREYTQHGEWF